MHGVKRRRKRSCGLQRYLSIAWAANMPTSAFVFTLIITIVSPWADTRKQIKVKIRAKMKVKPGRRYNQSLQSGGMVLASHFPQPTSQESEAGDSRRTRTNPNRLSEPTLHQCSVRSMSAFPLTHLSANCSQVINRPLLDSTIAESYTGVLLSTYIIVIRPDTIVYNSLCHNLL